MKTILAAPDLLKIEKSLFVPMKFS